MPTPRPTKQAYVSVRLLWPFARVVPIGPMTFAMLEREGLKPQDYANPNTRVRHRLAMDLLRDAIATTGDETIGLRAGESMEASDLDPLEYAARTCSNLGDAIRCISRYFSVMNEAAQITLEEQGELAIWSYSTWDDVPQPAAANDFVLAFATTFGRRYAGVNEPDVEVHLMHDAPTHASEYARVFRAPVRFGMPKNALVFPRARLSLPMQNANPGLQASFERRVAELSQRYRRNDASWKVREFLQEQLSGGGFGMPLAARRLGMSVATLRRRLDDEGTSHTALLDEVRRELSQRYLKDERLSVSDAAFLLGFADVKTFNKAFKRWSGGVAPANFRVRGDVAH